jgi:predicted Zn-ribbon and HTH transcriptional regulator
MEPNENSDSEQPASETLRQQLIRLLSENERGFEDLRIALELTPRALESELRHVQRTIRHQQGILRMTPAQCLDCGFVFKGRESRHLHAPSRCPKCRSEHIESPRFRIDDK